MENEGLCVRILACLLLLHSELSDANFVYYLDGVRSCLNLVIEITSKFWMDPQNPLNHNPKNSVSLLEGANETVMWYERIPSSANPADLLSRFAVHEACKRFSCEPKGDVALTDEILEFLRCKIYNPKLGGCHSHCHSC